MVTRETLLDVTDEASELALAQATVAMLRARLSELERLADTDALTPLLNRRAFFRELNRAIQSNVRHGVPSALLYIDMDGLKSINDAHGHAAGDAAILHVARFLRDHTRLTDIVARIGGDEFAIILTHVDAKIAKAKARGLAHGLAATALSHNQAPIRVTIGCGVTMIMGDDDAASALARADTAMYASRLLENGSQ